MSETVSQKKKPSETVYIVSLFAFVSILGNIPQS